MEDETQTMDNKTENTETTESNEAPESEESEIQIPENIEIDENIDSEKIEEPESIENLVETSGSFTPIFKRSQVTPFLKPVENLEQDLQNIPTQTQPREDTQPEVYNAPQYSGDYETSSYEARTENTYPQRFVPINPAREEFIMPMMATQFSGEMQPGLLKQTEVTGWRTNESLRTWDRVEDKKYATSELSKRRRRDDF